MKHKPSTAGGRPPKHPADRRSSTFIVRMTPNERLKLERLAEKQNCTMNDVFRSALQPSQQ